jgi:ABC-type branched-subunit amino acid transport system substrate-binding protein
MSVATARTRLRSRRRQAAFVTLAALTLLLSACGSRLTGQDAALAQGANSNNGRATGGTNLAASSGGSTTGTAATASCTSSASSTTTTAKPGSTTTASKHGTTTTSSSTTTTTQPCSSGGSGTGGSGTVLASGPHGSGGAATGGSAAAAAAAPGAATAAASATAPCGPNGNLTPAGGNGGATATGVTANSITVGNIASISGVAPGLTQSAQQATEAWAAYVNSTGGICGRQVKVQPFDDGNDSGTNYADAQQACSSDFAMVGNASGFDDGSAQAVSGCGIPDMSAEVSTAAAGGTADIFGASPGNDHYWALGPANYLKSLYPNAIKHAAMIYLNVSATQTQAAHEVAAYESVGFSYGAGNEDVISTTPTNANYGAIVQTLQSDGVQYVTEYSDDNSAERLLQAMQQANYTPQVVDWFSEEYTPDFAQQTSPESNGDLVLMSATASYEDAGSNPGMQLMESWLNRVAPGYHHDIFAILAWSAGLAFEQAIKEVGPDLTRPAVISKLQGITSWTGDGVTPQVNIGQKIPANCFFYMKIENGAFQRIYPTAPNSYDCNSGFYQY